MCEMSRSSWGAGPTGSPPHTRMTSSSCPSMQLHTLDDVSINRLQRCFVFMYQLDFHSPFLFSGASGLYLYLTYSNIIVQVLVVIPGTICMWDSLSCYLSGSCLCQHMLYYCVPWFSGHLIVCTIASAGIGMPPPPPIAGTHSTRLFALACHLLRV